MAFRSSFLPALSQGLPSALGGLFELVRTGAMHAMTALFICASLSLVTGFVVFVERGQRKILVNYAKRQVGNKVYGGQSSHLPLKLNMSGVIPPIFASSIILFPATVAGWFGSSDSMRWLKDIAATLSPGQPIYVIAVRSRHRFLLFLLHGAGIQFQGNCRQPEEERCLRSRHPPRRTDGALHRQDPDASDAGGAVYVTLVCLLPEFLILKWNVPFYFGGTVC
jgi:preprotein translocase subunit SecY